MQGGGLSLLLVKLREKSADMHAINATVTRTGKWWVAEFIINGHEYGTQAKHLSQIPAQVADAASLMTGQHSETFTVMLTTKDPTWAELIEEYQPG